MDEQHTSVTYVNIFFDNKTINFCVKLNYKKCFIQVEKSFVEYQT